MSLWNVSVLSFQERRKISLHLPTYWDRLFPHASTPGVGCFTPVFPQKKKQKIEKWGWERTKEAELRLLRCERFSFFVTESVEKRVSLSRPLTTRLVRTLPSVPLAPNNREQCCVFVPSLLSPETFPNCSRINDPFEGVQWYLFNTTFENAGFNFKSRSQSVDSVLSWKVHAWTSCAAISAVWVLFTYGCVLLSWLLFSYSSCTVEPRYCDPVLYVSRLIRRRHMWRRMADTHKELLKYRLLACPEKPESQPAMLLRHPSLYNH